MSPYKDYSALRPEILGIFSPSDRKTDSACIRMGRNHGSGGRPLGSKDKDQRTRTVESETKKAAKAKRKEDERKEARREGVSQMQAALTRGQGSRAVNAAPAPRSEGAGGGRGSGGGAAGRGSVANPPPAIDAASVAQEGDGQGAAGGAAAGGADFDTVVQESIRVAQKHSKDSAGMSTLSKQAQLQLLGNKLATHNLEYVNVKDAGNCFFEAVIWQYGSTVKAPTLPFMASIQSLRNELARWYRENHQLLHGFFPGCDADAWDQHAKSYMDQRLTVKAKSHCSTKQLGPRLLICCVK